MPPFNVMEKPLVPIMDLCICLAAFYSAMSSPPSLLSEENNPLEILLFCFFGLFVFSFFGGEWGGGGKYKVSALKHRFNFSD